MKLDVYGTPLEEYDVYSENPKDSCFDTSVPPEYLGFDGGDRF